MIGTLWKDKWGFLICVQYEDGWYTLKYTNSPEKAQIHKSIINQYYKQITKPPEGI